jgi:hypothetical protein
MRLQKGVSNKGNLFTESTYIWPVSSYDHIVMHIHFLTVSVSCS